MQPEPQSVLYSAGINCIGILQCGTWRVKGRGRTTTTTTGIVDRLVQQEAFEKCWAHSPLRAAARRLF